MDNTLHKPPIFCVKCRSSCNNSIVGIYFNKEAEIIFEFVCLKCNTEFQVFKMSFAQSVAYCICLEQQDAMFLNGNETVN